MRLKHGYTALETICYIIVFSILIIICSKSIRQGMSFHQYEQGLKFYTEVQTIQKMMTDLTKSNQCTTNESNLKIKTVTDDIFEINIVEAGVTVKYNDINFVCKYIDSVTINKIEHVTYKLDIKEDFSNTQRTCQTNLPMYEIIFTSREDVNQKHIPYKEVIYYVA